MNLNFDKKCRTCLAEHQPMFSLFEVYEHDLTLATILRNCMSTAQVSKYDGLPSDMCDNCISVLTQYYNFSIVFEESEKHLKSLLWKVEIHSAQESLEENSELEYDRYLEGSSHLSPTNGLFIPQVDKYAAYDNEFLEVKNIFNFSEPGEYVYNEEIKKEVINPEDFENLEPAPNEYFDIHIPGTDDMKLIDVDGSYESVTKYKCNLCGEAHLYSTSFQQHMRMKHSLSNIICEEYASQIRVKIEPKSESLEKSSLAYLKKLDSLLNREPEYVCTICNKSFFSSSQLKQHSKLHDPNKKYACDVCGSRFIRKTYLNDHMEKHSTEKKHVCKFCGKAFRRRTVLTAHKRIHTHPNHYICELCGKSFANASRLKSHKILIHVREKNFICLICNLRFSLKSTLNRHVLRHQKRENGEKGFHCSECEMKYSDKSSLKRHYQTKHQGKVIQCPECPKKYTNNVNLLKHKKMRHST